jgi:hypothetical protein
VGGAGVLAGQSQGQWKNLDFAAQQLQAHGQFDSQQAQLARDNAFRQQQFDAQQRQIAEQNRLAQQQQQIENDYRQKLLGVQRSNIDAGLQKANIAANTRISVAGQQSDDFLTKLGQQNDQFLQGLGLKRDQLAALQQYRNTTTSQAAINEMHRYDTAMANSQTDAQRLMLTGQHYNQMAAIQQMEETGRNTRAAASQQGAADRFNAGSQNSANRFNAEQQNVTDRQGRSAMQSRLNALSRIDPAKLTDDEKAELGSLKNNLAAPYAPQMVQPQAVRQQMAIPSPAAIPAVTPPGAAPSPPAAPPAANADRAQAQAVIQAISAMVQRQQEIPDDGLRALVVILGGVQQAKQWLAQNGYNARGQYVGPQ